MVEREIVLVIKIYKVYSSSLYQEEICVSKLRNGWDELENTSWRKWAFSCVDVVWQMEQGKLLCDYLAGSATSWQ